MTEVKQQFDVLILGAGPAGISCALKFADTGIKVALIDKSTFPRDKICGDALSWDVFNQLGKLSDTLQSTFLGISEASPTGGLQVIVDKKDRFFVPFVTHGKVNEIHVCKRMDFDNLLFETVRNKPNIHIIENFTAKTVEINATSAKLTSKDAILEGKIIVLP